jgi:putative sugar O-methyltransferase
MKDNKDRKNVPAAVKKEGERAMKTEGSTFESDMASMFEEMRASGTALTLPAKWWDELCEKNAQQLRTHGLDNFKQNVVRNYFTWVGIPADQLLYLALRVPVGGTIRCLASSLCRHATLTWRESLVYNFLTRMLWQFAEKSFPDDCQALEEPLIGNPFRVWCGNKLISQDLGNSLIEYHTMVDSLSVSARNRIECVLELGAGSGRNAHVFIDRHKPLRRYIVVDIPPALLVSQNYLSQVFPDKRIMRFRPFQDFSEVADEFYESEICFLLSTQVEKLPANCVDLAINISSLHEMRMDQIHYWLERLFVLTRAGGHLFLKQWKRAEVPGEDLIIMEPDWPVGNWHKVFWRNSAVQVRFFEALLRKEH